MKNIKLILASLCLMLVGCSEEDDPMSSSSYSLSGTYNATAVSMGVDCDNLLSGMCSDFMIINEEDCTEVGGTWMTMLELMDEVPGQITFVDDGTCGDGCTYNCSSATSCTLSDGEVSTSLTVNADGTVTSVMLTSWDPYCGDEYDEMEYDNYDTQADCEANGSAEGAGDGTWYEAGSNCSQVTWTMGS